MVDELREEDEEQVEATGIGAVVTWLVEDGIRHEASGWQTACGADGTGAGDVA